MKPYQKPSVVNVRTFCLLSSFTSTKDLLFFKLTSFVLNSNTACFCGTPTCLHTVTSWALFLLRYIACMCMWVLDNNHRLHCRLWKVWVDVSIWLLHFHPSADDFHHSGFNKERLEGCFLYLHKTRQTLPQNKNVREEQNNCLRHCNNCYNVALVMICYCIWFTCLSSSICSVLYLLFFMYCII